MRINKYLSDKGVCSRREADRRIEAGDVLINGRVAVLGDQVNEEDEVIFCNTKIDEGDDKVILLVNKPVGVVCTENKREGRILSEVIDYPVRVYPVGRLDKDSEGLILMTNDGSIVNRIMRSGNKHEKEYVVTVDRDIDDGFVRDMSGGVPILDTVTRKCVVEKIDKRTFRIILTQGLNRQIRRMCEYFGYRVVKLKRIRIMNLRLGDIKVGRYREITAKERDELFSLIKDSSEVTIGKRG